MDRRQILRGALAVSLAPAFGLRNALARNQAATRRVRPSDSEWPTAAEWEALGRDVGGNLVKPMPLLFECDLAPAGASCRDVLSHLQNPYYIGDQPSGTQVSGWLDAWTPAPSAYAIACRRAADAVAAVRFARRRNIRLVIKGGGHSYQGTSASRDSLLVWTRAMHAITVHDEFVSKGCAGLEAPSPAVTAEAGALWMDVYDAVTTRSGRYVQGGGCATVGVAGLVQSGGFGSFSKRFGTAAAGLIEAEIVTADGVLRTVNAHTDADLYWALKGGGGGSWGVVTKLTLRTHELPEYFGAAWGTIQAVSDAGFRRLIGHFVDFYAERLFNPHWGESVAVGKDNKLKISMVCQGLDPAITADIWKPFFDWVTASAPEFKCTEELGSGSRAAREWWDVEARRRRGSTSVVFDNRAGAPSTHAWWSGDQEQVGAFLHGYDSVWLPDSLLLGAERGRLADALFASSRHTDVELHFNKGLAGAPPASIAAARNTATNPAVLGAFALAIIANGGPPRYPGLPGITVDDVVATRDALDVDRAADVLLEIAPAAGSYVSESNFFNRRWQDAFWGPNYARLKSIKESYDPDGLFFVRHGVGTEDWSPDGFARLK